MAATTQAGRPLDEEHRKARIALVEEHIRFECEHDMAQLMATMGADPTFDLNAQRINGRAAVHDFYADLMRGFPDLNIELKHLHASAEAVTVEVQITGTHRHEWSGVPAAGHRVDFPLACVYTFDAKERLAGERVYFDSGLMHAQMRGEFTPGS